MTFSGAGDTSLHRRTVRHIVKAIGSAPLGDAFVAAAGAAITIYVLAWAGRITDVLLLVAPFGASCILVFALPQSPLAQPRNVIGGHVIATLAGLLVQVTVGATPLGFALGVGLAVGCMILSNTTHPPAGADPIVVLLASAKWTFLVTPIFIGAGTIVLIGLAYHRVVSRKNYPAP